MIPRGILTGRLLIKIGKISTKTGITFTKIDKSYKGRLKCIQHFIQHRKFFMLDEMLDAFEMSEIFKKIQKEEKNYVG